MKEWNHSLFIDRIGVEDKKRIRGDKNGYNRLP